MAAEVKAIFFDLDGTLVDTKTDRIPASAQWALHRLKEKKIKLFIASGRPPVRAELIKAQTDIRFDGKVLLNGQYCVDGEDVPFYKKPLTEAQLRSILKWLEKNQEINCNFMEAGLVYANIQGAGPRSEFPVRPVGRCLEHPTYQVSPRVGPEADEEILAQVDGVKSARWSDWSTDLIPADGGKTVGMQKLLDRYGLRREECMAFGDGANDIEMLGYVGIGVAMGNGFRSVKQAADYVTDTVAADGILKALRHFKIL